MTEGSPHEVEASPQLSAGSFKAVDTSGEI